jgi:hypothetical protein
VSTMAHSYPQQRIFNLAARLGCTVREAARLCARKGARLRRERARQCACVGLDKAEVDREARIRALRWDLKDEF